MGKALQFRDLRTRRPFGNQSAAAYIAPHPTQALSESPRSSNGKEGCSQESRGTPASPGLTPCPSVDLPHQPRPRPVVRLRSPRDSPARSRPDGRDHRADGSEDHRGAR